MSACTNHGKSVYPTLLIDFSTGLPPFEQVGGQGPSTTVLQMTAGEVFIFLCQADPVGDESKLDETGEEEEHARAVPVDVQSETRQPDRAKNYGI
jgi:hypothetical protein